MILSFEKISSVTQDITKPLEELLKWRWEESRQAILSEFASGKAEQTLAVLRSNFKDEWDRKTIKKAPKDLKDQLGELANITKEQKLFTRPATDQHPATLAIWWPWGHGSTLSLRLTILENSYEYTPQLSTENRLVAYIRSTLFRKKK
ncbi:MAG: hypothetical protein ACI9LM_002331 [Alteromonadaceae bacterium]|jgi:hypothetical protein